MVNDSSIISRDTTLCYPKTWQIGDVTVTKIVEWEGATDLTWLLPDATSDALLKIQWLQPHFLTSDGMASSSIHALVIETPSQRIVVDTCIGADKQRTVMPAFDRLQSGFLADIEAAGFPPASIDIVLCTHLHVDHVGWNTMLVDGSWAPTFPNARYLFDRAEYEYWAEGTDITLGGWDISQREAFDDSVKPVVDAGLVDLIEAPHRVCDEISLIPTIGHSPGHVSVAIASNGERALITGDFVHHPCQLAHVDWSAVVDFDQAMARKTRWRMFEDLADQPILLIGTHFPGPTVGHVQRDQQAFCLKVE